MPGAGFLIFSLAQVPYKRSPVILTLWDKPGALGGADIGMNTNAQQKRIRICFFPGSVQEPQPKTAFYRIAHLGGT